MKNEVFHLILFFIIFSSLPKFYILSFYSLNILTMVILKSVYDNSIIWIFLCVNLIIFSL